MAVTSTSLPVQILLGIYLGMLTGIFPALVAWAFAFIFKYITGLTVPSFAVVVLGVAIAGVNGGFLAFNDPTVLQSANSVAIVTAILVVMLISFYSHNMGDKLGTAMPRRVSLRGLRERTLSREVVELVEGRNRVRINVVGGIEDLEGYPPLPADLRQRIAAAVEEWTFPADRTLDELETLVGDRLREEFELSDAEVHLDEQARASIAAAPPFSGVSRTVPDGQCAVSVTALLPAGLAAGDEVTVLLGGPDVPPNEAPSVQGKVLGISHQETEPASTEPVVEAVDPVEPTPEAITTTGGDGRVTVAIPRSEAGTLLRSDTGRVIVTSRGTRREFELVSLLRRAGNRIRRLRITEDGPLDGTTIREAGVRDRYGVAILAVRHDGAWWFAPRGEATVSGGDDLFVAGPRSAIEAFREAAQ